MNIKLGLAAFLLLISYIACGQNQKTFTAADYDHAVSMLGRNTGTLVDNDIRPRWLPDRSVW